MIDKKTWKSGEIAKVSKPFKVSGLRVGKVTTYQPISDSI